MLPSRTLLGLTVAAVVALSSCSDSGGGPPSKAEVLEGIGASDIGDQLSPEQEECIADILFDRLDDSQLRQVADGKQPQEVDATSGDQIVADCGVGADQGPPTSDVSVPPPDTETVPADGSAPGDG